MIPFHILLAALLGWLEREQRDVIRFLREENRVLKAQLEGKRLRLDAKRRRFDAVVVWSLDRLGRNLKHLITLLDDFQALGIAFITQREGLDWPCTPQ